MRLIVIPLVLIAALPVRADGRVTQDEVLEAVQRGAALPLVDLERRVRAGFAGDILKVEVEREHGRLIYEFKLIDAVGRRSDVMVDAATGAILEVERK